MARREIIKEISYKEFLNETEGKYKHFRIKYNKFHNEVYAHVRESQSKNEILRILESPAIKTYRIVVSEMVDDG